MNRGKIEQVGSPTEVFDHPASEFVMDFLGNVNVFRGRVYRGVADLNGWQVPMPGCDHAEERAVRAFIRPHELEIVRPNGDGPQGDHLPTRVVHVHRSGALTRVHLTRLDDNTPLTVEISHERRGDLDLRPGEVVGVSPRHVRVFDEPGDYVI